jgi:hypothetical protein
MPLISELNVSVMSSEAPKARNAKAWGNAPGTGVNSTKR